MDNLKSPKTIIKNTLWCLRLIFRSNPTLFIAVYVCQLLVSTVPFIRNRIFSQLIDDLVYHSSSQNYRNYTFVLFIVFLISTSIFFYLQSQIGRVMDIRLQAYLRKMFIGKVSGLDYQHLEGKDTGNLISKVDEEFGWRIRQTSSDISNIFANLVSLTAITIIILPRFPVLWLILFFSQIPQYFVQRYWVQKDWQIHEENSDKNKLVWDLNFQLRQTNYIAELRVNNAIQFLYQKFCNIFDFFADKRTDLRVRQAPSEFGLIIFSTAINAICLFVLISQTQNDLLTIGLFTFYFQSITQAADFFRGLVFSSVSITENSYHIGNFKKVMGLKNIITGGTHTISTNKPPKIEFVDVSFKYPGSKKYVYQHLNLSIDPGEEIAIVGQNGAGKSTLIKLICHFYEPTAGHILVNGIDLKTIKLDKWYQQLSYLAQEFNNYRNLSLRENIILGNPKIINDSQVLDALRRADANFISKYPKKLDTPLSIRYGGEEPSWGQWQKIAIARIFYRNSPIMILDEPTASIDAVSEAKIFNRLYQQVKNKTLIIVSHRFSTVRNAKRIIVIDKGKVVEQGSHQELLRHQGLYAKSFLLQAKGYTTT